MNNTDRLNRYALQVEYIEDEGFVASFKELGSSATGHGDTRAEAIADLEAAVADLLEVTGDDLPAPFVAKSWASYSGRVTLRLPRTLHAQLDHLADADGVSLNYFMTDILRSGATALASGCMFGAVRNPSEINREMVASAEEMAIALSLAKNMTDHDS